MQQLAGVATQKVASDEDAQTQEYSVEHAAELAFPILDESLVPIDADLQSLPDQWVVDTPAVAKSTINNDVKGQQSLPTLDGIWGQAVALSPVSSETSALESDLLESDSLESDLIESDLLESDLIEADLIDVVSVPIEAETLESLTPDNSFFSAQSTAESQAPSRASITTVRIDVRNLDRLNYVMGELLTYQNRQVLQNEQLMMSVKRLINRFNQQQQHLHLLQAELDEKDHHLKSVGRHSNRAAMLGRNAGSGTNAGREGGISFSTMDTTLQIDPPIDYTEHVSDAQSLVQRLLDEGSEVAEPLEGLEQFVRQSQQILDKQQRLLTEARDALMDSSMVPIGETLSQFEPMLERLAILHHKSVRLQLNGTSVLVDKVVAERLWDPLIHLMRNAFDHGIEAPHIRQSQGKSTTGTITLSAFHQGRHLMIQLQDDGQGLNFARIRDRAIAKQLLTPQDAQTVTHFQLTELLFEPGFSTVSVVNDLSGRGVGLDVVRSQIQALQGQVTVESEAGQGTCFTLQIPLSMTIAKLLLCQAGSKTYALKTDSIEQILSPQPQQIRIWEDGKALRWQQDNEEQWVPIFSLSQLLNRQIDDDLHTRMNTTAEELGHNRPSSAPIILMRYQTQWLAFEIDQLIEEQELTIRPFSSIISPPAYVYGGSILADGRLALVIDGAVLAKSAIEQRRSPISAAANTAFSSMPLEKILLPSASILPEPLMPQALPSSASSEDTVNDPSVVNGNDSSVVEDVEEIDRAGFILLIDDSSTVRRNLHTTLQKGNYRVVQAQNGHEALSVLEQVPGIQVIISDLEMPKMNGLEFLKQQQQNPLFQHIPVIMLTSRSSEQLMNVALGLGAVAYLTKPYAEEKLLNTVEWALDLSTQRSVVPLTSITDDSYG